jgi:hypothetical protein
VYKDVVLPLGEMATPSPMVVKTAVDDIVRCVRDMESVFENTSFEDVEIPAAMLEDIVATYKPNNVEVEITRNRNGHRRDEDDNLQYMISVPAANAITYADMDPPTVYDPYESHGDSDSEDDSENKVRFEWHNRTVHVQAAFGTTLHIGEHGRRISVWFKHEIPEDPEDLIDYLWTVCTLFRCPMIEHSMRHRHRTSKEALIIRKINRRLFPSD